MRALWWLLAAAPLAFAQLDNDTITVTASRLTNLQPDQVLISVSISADQNTPIDDVLALVSGAGFSAADLQYASTPNGPPGPVQYTNWMFNRAVPFDKLKDTLTALAKAQQGLPKNSGQMLSYYVQPAQASQGLQDAQTCVYPALVSDARRQAERVAGAAGLGVGPVVALGQGSGPVGIGGVGLPIGTPVFRAGDFSGLITTAPASFGSFLYTPPITTTNCSMTVQFRLVR